MQNTLPGLNENETLIYSTLIKLGPSQIGALQNAVTLQRSNIYANMKTLVAKGLVEERKGTKTTFAPVNPEQLIDIADQKLLEVRRQRESLEVMVPELLSQFRESSYKPLVKFREGLKGITSQYEELLKDGHRIDSIEDGGQMVRYLGKYASYTFPMKRTELGVYNRVIAPNNNQNNENSPELLRETRFVAPEDLPFRMDIKLTEHLVSLVTFQKDNAVGILIDNQEIRENFSMLFEYIWNNLGDNE